MELTESSFRHDITSDVSVVVFCPLRVCFSAIVIEVVLADILNNGQNHEGDAENRADEDK